MEQKLRFGLVLGRLAILKKKFGPDYKQLLWSVFSCFQAQKDFLFFKVIVASELKSCINEAEKNILKILEI